MRGRRNEPRNERLDQVFCMRCSQVSARVYDVLFLICGCSLEGLQQLCPLPSFIRIRNVVSDQSYKSIFILLPY